MTEVIKFKEDYINSMSIYCCKRPFDVEGNPRFKSICTCLSLQDDLLVSKEKEKCQFAKSYTKSYVNHENHTPTNLVEIMEKYLHSFIFIIKWQ
jgi:hypothetical protein